MRLSEHPDIGETKDVAVAVAQPATMLGGVVLQEDNGLVGRHDAPCRFRELIPWRAVRIQLRDVLAIDPAELVTDADQCELRDAGGPAQARALAAIVPRRDG